MPLGNCTAHDEPVSTPPSPSAITEMLHDLLLIIITATPLTVGLTQTVLMITQTVLMIAQTEALISVLESPAEKCEQVPPQRLQNLPNLGRLPIQHEDPRPIYRNFQKYGRLYMKIGLIVLVGSLSCEFVHYHTWPVNIFSTAAPHFLFLCGEAVV